MADDDILYENLDEDEDDEEDEDDDEEEEESDDSDDDGGGGDDSDESYWEPGDSSDDDDHDTSDTDRGFTVDRSPYGDDDQEYVVDSYRSRYDDDDDDDDARDPERPRSYYDRDLDDDGNDVDREQEREAERVRRQISDDLEEQRDELSERQPPERDAWWQREADDEPQAPPMPPTTFGESAFTRANQQIAPSAAPTAVAEPPQQSQQQGPIASMLDQAAKKLFQDELGRERTLMQAGKATVDDVPLLKQIIQDWRKESGRAAPNERDPRDMANFWKYTEDWTGVAADRADKAERLGVHPFRNAMFQAAGQQVEQERQQATRAAQQTQPRSPEAPRMPGSGEGTRALREGGGVVNSIVPPMPPTSPRTMAADQEDADFAVGRPGSARTQLADYEDADYTRVRPGGAVERPDSEAAPYSLPDRTVRPGGAAERPTPMNDDAYEMSGVGMSPQVPSAQSSLPRHLTTVDSPTILAAEREDIDYMRGRPGIESLPTLQVVEQIAQQVVQETGQSLPITRQDLQLLADEIDESNVSGSLRLNVGMFGMKLGLPRGVGGEAIPGTEFNMRLMSPEYAPVLAQRLANMSYVSDLATALGDLFDPLAQAAVGQSYQQNYGGEGEIYPTRFDGLSIGPYIAVNGPPALRFNSPLGKPAYAVSVNPWGLVAGAVSQARSVLGENFESLTKEQQGAIIGRAATSTLAHEIAHSAQGIIQGFGPGDAIHDETFQRTWSSVETLVDQDPRIAAIEQRIADVWVRDPNWAHDSAAILNAEPKSWGAAGRTITLAAQRQELPRGSSASVSQLMQSASPPAQHGPFLSEVKPAERIQAAYAPLVSQVADIAQERPLDAAASVLLAMQQGSRTVVEPGGDNQASVHLASAFSNIIRNPNASDSAWAKPALESVARLAWAEQAGQSPANAPDDYVRSWIGSWRSGQAPPLAEQLDRQMREVGAWTPSSPLPVNWRAKWGDDITSDYAQARLMRDPSFRQAVDRTLTQAEADSICGPIAARALFRAAKGEDVSLRETIQMARAVGFDPSKGMAGIDSQVRLMQNMGLDAQKTGVDALLWSKEVSEDRPVVINSGAHYWTATGYDKEKGKFYVGSTGLALGGNTWLSVGEMSAASQRLGKGGVTGGIVTKMAPVAQAVRPTAPQPTQPVMGPSAAAAFTSEAPDDASVRQFTKRVIQEMPDIPSYRQGATEDDMMRGWAPALDWLEKQTGLPADYVAGLVHAENAFGTSSQARAAREANNFFSLAASGHETQSGVSPGGRWAAYQTPKHALANFVWQQASPKSYQNDAGGAATWKNRRDVQKWVEHMVKGKYIVEEPGFPISGWVKNINAGAEKYRRATGR